MGTGGGNATIQTAAVSVDATNQTAAVRVDATLLISSSASATMRDTSSAQVGMSSNEAHDQPRRPDAGLHVPGLVVAAPTRAVRRPPGEIAILFDLGPG
jgi:hypothetical protein